VERLSFVDWARVCIWGWSFGGYLAAMALAEETRTNYSTSADLPSVTGGWWRGLALWTGPGCVSGAGVLAATWLPWP
jgi:hypothetical protein